MCVENGQLFLVSARQPPYFVGRNDCDFTLKVRTTLRYIKYYIK